VKARTARSHGTRRLVAAPLSHGGTAGFDPLVPYRRGSALVRGAARSLARSRT